MLQKTSHFMRQANLINGEWVQADSGQTVDVNNPATGLKIGTVPKSGKAETRRAIEAADAAFKSWRKTTALERSKLLRKLHDAMMDNQDVLAELLTIEQGKSLFESKGEIGSAAAYILWFAEEGRRTYGDVVPSPWADRRILVTKEPVGVIAAITPWNFPSSMLARKLGPALAAGCTAVRAAKQATHWTALDSRSTGSAALGSPRCTASITRVTSLTQQRLSPLAAAGQKFCVAFQLESFSVTRPKTIRICATAASGRAAASRCLPGGCPDERQD